MDHALTANTYSNIAVLYDNSEEYDMAINHHLRALKIRESKVGPDDFYTGFTHE